MARHKYTADLLAPIVARSRSISQVLRELGLNPSGGNYQYVKRMVQRHALDVDHFTGQGWSRGIPGSRGRDIPDSDVFVERSPITSGSALQKRLLRLGRRYECAECHLTEWRGQKISLDLDHINGVNDDNRLENLRFLCPNCHRITETWGVKNVHVVQLAGDNSLRS